MRKTWITVAMIALCVGLAVGYRMGRQGNPPSGSVEGARRSEATPIGSGARQDGRASSETPPETPSETPSSAPGSPAEQPVPRQRVWGYDIASHRSSEGGTTAPVERTPAPIAPVRGSNVAPPVASPASPPVAPAVPHPVSSPAKTKETPALVDDPESDRHPPVLQFLRFDPPEIQDGGAAVLSVGASDDLSGVKTVSGTVRSPSEAAVIFFVAQDTTGSGVFSASIAIPRQAETGDWFVGGLQIVDKANNPLIAAFPKTAVPTGGRLRVASAESDSTAPSVHRVWVDKGTVGAGEKNWLGVDVDDDRSGVASITGVFQGPSKSAFINFSCRPNGETSWAGDVVVPANADCGEWTLQQLRVADKANNTAFLTMDSPEVGRVSFTVAGGGGCDSDPPVIDALYFAPAIVSNTSASELTVTVAVHDEGSGVAFLTGRIDGPVSTSGQVPRIFFTSQPDPRNPDAPLTARITVPQFAASGIWRVASVEVTDKAHNRRIYNRADPVLAEAGFTVE